mmetsp:Transcript_10109/g.20893  ORF Transcript_10109/g.20893 Transcript_10109/m.20893 type:complete len:216 (-) Transcript_10109:736-1383(-)
MSIRSSEACRPAFAQKPRKLSCTPSSSSHRRRTASPYDQASGALTQSISGSEASFCSGPSRKPEPRPRSRSLAPVFSAMDFMFCPWGPRTFRFTWNCGSSSMPSMNWHWHLPWVGGLLYRPAWFHPMPFRPLLRRDSAECRCPEAAWSAFQSSVAHPALLPSFHAPHPRRGARALAPPHGVGLAPQAVAWRGPLALLLSCHCAAVVLPCASLHFA